MVEEKKENKSVDLIVEVSGNLAVKENLEAFK